MDILKRLADSIVVPVVVLEKVEDAIPTAKAMAAGGIDTMEITFRTACAPECIKAVAESCPEVLVGAGTIVNVEQAKLAVSMGAKFIVSPGFIEEVVAWCVENNIAVAPGCVTPSEIMAAKKFGLKMVKFFPANIYGGLNALKNLAAPFGDMKFLPTGGVNADNVGEFIAAPFIHAVGGSWVCPKADIAAGNWDKITQLCADARKAALGFEVAHVGINMPDGDSALALAGDLNNAFGLPVKDGNSSVFVSSGIEIVKSMYLGANGHIAIRTNSIPLAAAALEKKGYTLNAESAKYKNGKMIAVYLEKEFGGFAIHLLQK